jgi:SHS2 domain-containing protein
MGVGIINNQGDHTRLLKRSWIFVPIHKIRYTGIVMKTQTGFQEIEHTADWEIKVWAPDLTSLLASAAHGMFQLSNTVLAEGPRVARDFEICFDDRESLLVDFLSELLFLGEQQRVAFDDYRFDVQDNVIKVQVRGAPIDHQAKEIKAVTYHGMKILEKEGSLEVNIVFDV